MPLLFDGPIEALYARTTLLQTMSSTLLATFQRRVCLSTACRSRLLHAGPQASAAVGIPSSVNSDEIAHFSKLSSEWWDERGEFAFLHKMNPVRMQFIRDKLVEVAQDADPDLETDGSDILRGLDVLDVGSGGGLLSEVRHLRTNNAFNSTNIYVGRA